MKDKITIETHEGVKPIKDFLVTECWGNKTLCNHESDGLCYTSDPPQYKCLKCGEFYN